MLRFLVILCVCTFWTAIVYAEPLRLAVASNFLMPARALAERFKQMSGREVAISAGSTGKLYAQIVNGAPYSVFLAANRREPRRLEESGKAVAGSRFTYVTGRLVLWSQDLSQGMLAGGAERIRSGAFTRLAIANPKTAPYGAAAVQVMQALGLEPARLGSRLVRAENVTQAYQFVASGNAELGFVAFSQVSNPERPAGGSHWLVPAVLHDPIEQQAVLLKRAEDDVAAVAFLAFLGSPRARELIAAYGYGPG